MKDDKESHGQRSTFSVFETLLKDLRFAVRMFRKNPGFTAVAVLTLSLGIGANAAIFTVVNTVVLRSLPIDHPDRVMSVNLTNLKDRDAFSFFSYPKYKDYRDRNDVLSGLYGYRAAPISLGRNGGSSERVWSNVVSGNYFDVLGVSAYKGRMLTQSDDQVPDANPVAVVSYNCWQARFGSDPDLVGKTVLFNSHPFTIIGVAPKGFAGTDIMFSPEIWTPFMMDTQIEPGLNNLNKRASGDISLGGRLKSGVTPQQAQSSLNILAGQLAKEYPDTDQGSGIELSAPGLLLQLRNPILGFATVLMATVCLVLLIACINLASMLMARAAGRRREIAIRLAIGAARTRIIRQLLSESILLSAIGGAGGILLAIALTGWVTTARLPINYPITINLEVDWRVSAFTFVLSMVTGIGFGLAPALQATKTDLIPALKDDSSASGYKRSIIRNVLVVAQIGLSLSLLVAAGLVVRSLQRAQIIGPGFETERALTMSVDLGLQGYNDQKGRQFYRQLVDRVQTLPGVRSASIASYLPLSLELNWNPIFIEGQPVKRGNDTPVSYNSSIEPKYFESMGIPLVAGRDFDSQDIEGSPSVAIINETFAHRFWPGENAIGKRFRMSSSTSSPIEVVGIARDGKYFSLGETPHTFVYLPMQQRYSSHVGLIVRTASDSETMIATIRREVQQLDPSLSVYDVKTLAEHMGIGLFPLRIGAWVVGGFGILALTLAAIGIYGTMAYSVSQRSREMGIRMALGASRGAVLRLVIKQGLVLATIGLAGGLTLSLFTSQLLKPVLYGVSPTDIVGFTGVTLLLAAVAFLACLIPASKATRVDPIIALRHD